MGEILDILDANGKPTGKTALKSEAHKSGLYHNTIHLWLYTDNEKILLQQRSHKKLIYPLLWDVSIAGHIDTGETFTQAAVRETEEEISLKLKENDLVKIGTHLHKSIYNDGQIKDFEFHQIYIAKLHVELKELSPQKDEVEAIKLVSFEEFEDLLSNSKNNSHFIASNTPYYLSVLKHIKNHTK